MNPNSTSRGNSHPSRSSPGNSFPSCLYSTSYNGQPKVVVPKYVHPQTHNSSSLSAFPPQQTWTAHCPWRAPMLLSSSKPQLLAQTGLHTAGSPRAIQPTVILTSRIPGPTQPSSTIGSLPHPVPCHILG
ncbi:hypothetical protein MLD38_021317 [Melastoma candidum]|uniref:Uncharacterized protein n=1 Tax=Melastoma candidum TaxID=119954 RepID=A0ACB9QFL3_9MYRT|nr:hypothetical protein MLD38_021317 [Melastoma candidum]